MRLILSLIALALVFGCGPKKPELNVPIPARAGQLRSVYLEKLAFAKSVETERGWLESECDAMLWNGKYSCGGGNPDLKAAEYPEEPGRFNRKPLPGCGPELGNSKTTWSRDMGMGLLAHGWCKKDIDILSRHRDYGYAHNWVMGSPLADGRVVYTPNIIGTLHQVIYRLGGPDSSNRLWPQAYPSGLTNYEAHLQMVNIWIRGEMEPRDSGLVSAEDISALMYDRVIEHSDREPECPFYQYMRGIYDGSLERAVDSLLASDYPKCEYGRDDFGNKAAEWLFSAKLVLKKLKLEQ